MGKIEVVDSDKKEDGRLMRDDINGRRFMVTAYYFPNDRYQKIDDVFNEFKEQPYLYGMAANRPIDFIEIPDFIVANIEWPNMVVPDGFFLTRQMIRVYIKFI